MVGNPLDKEKRDAAANTALRRSARLSKLLEREIRSSGPLTFAAYQDRVLYDPRLGYYGSGTVLFGEGGDFFTASSDSSLFACCLARYYAGLPDLDELLEVGAGDATLCRNLLPELARLDVLPRRYRILEPSPALRRRQRERLREVLAPEYFARVSWLSAPPTRPFSGLVLALEVLDALPVRRLLWSREHWWELHVDWKEGALAWTTAEPDARLAAVATGLPPPAGGWPEGYSTECCTRLKPWLAAVAAPLRRGQLLFLDYGYPGHEYYHAQRMQGTLICHYRHRAHFDPFFLPGLQDISASVDFSALAEAGEACGLALEGYADQADWLLACDLLAMLAKVPQDALRKRLNATRQAHYLLLSGATGARFKWLALSRDCSGPMKVWRACDRSFRLRRAAPESSS